MVMALAFLLEKMYEAFDDGESNEVRVLGVFLMACRIGHYWTQSSLSFQSTYDIVCQLHNSACVVELYL